jgi:predicted phage terminase large subunit-like protein
MFSLMKDENKVSKFMNDKFGYRSTTSSSSGSTGHGGDVRIADDPNKVSIKPNQADVDPKIEAVNQWYSSAWATRFNDPKKDIVIICQQRTKEKDLTGYIMGLEEASEKKFVKLILPMEFESNRRCKTIVLPSTNGKVWEDPRTKDGELLFPNFIGEQELKTLKANLGNEYRIAGQLQQRPAPAEGGIIKKHYFRPWKEPKGPPIIQIIQSWDCALEAKEMNSYSACTTWGLFEKKFLDDGIHKKTKHLMLLGVWRGRVEYPELREMAKKLYDDYRDDGNIPIKPDGKHVPNLVLVETKASGHSLIHDLRKSGVPVQGFDPSKYGDKIMRVRMVTPMLSSGVVYLPAKPPTYEKLWSYAEKFSELCAVFPNSDSRDVVDTMTQVLLRLMFTDNIFNPSDPREERYRDENRKFYG